MDRPKRIWIDEIDYYVNKVEGCTEYVRLDEHERLVQEAVDEALNREDICGLCGLPGADKMPHPSHWPGERVPDTELVHAECERAECQRAHAALTPKERHEALRRI